jgi:hypothetical protein
MGDRESREEWPAAMMCSQVGNRKDGHKEWHTSSTTNNTGFRFSVLASIAYAEQDSNQTVRWAFCLDPMFQRRQGNDGTGEESTQTAIASKVTTGDVRDCIISILRIHPLQGEFGGKHRQWNSLWLHQPVKRK